MGSEGDGAEMQRASQRRFAVTDACLTRKRPSLRSGRLWHWLALWTLREQGRRVRANNAVGQRKMKAHRVILVVDRLFGNRLRTLPDDVPVWIVGSPENFPAIIARRKDALSETTSFQDFPALSPADLASRIIATIEDHHGEYSQQPPMSRLTVIGADVSGILLDALEEADFRSIKKSDGAVEFTKKEEHYPESSVPR